MFISRCRELPRSTSYPVRYHNQRGSNDSPSHPRLMSLRAHILPINPAKPGADQGGFNNLSEGAICVTSDGVPKAPVSNSLYQIRDGSLE